MSQPFGATADGTDAEQNAEDIRASVRAIVLELAPGGDESARSDASLVDDLGFHSLALLELAFTLEDEFDLPPIDEETARSITTIASVEEHVLKSLLARGQATAAP